MKAQNALPRLTWSEVVARRLERHGLSGPLQAASPAGIARVLCGVHAQVMPAAELSIGLRIPGDTRPGVTRPGITRDEIQAALWTERSLVKTYGPRGTVHLLPAKDLPVWTGALSALPYARVDTRSGLLTDEQAEAVIEAISAVLEHAELTADELTGALVDRLGAWAGELQMGGFQSMWPRWRTALVAAGIRGALCFGPNRGRLVTYTSPHRWLPGFQPAGEQSALADVVRLYLHAYGPATPPQFAQWLAAPRRWAMELFEYLSADLQAVEVDGDQAWVTAGDTAALSSPPRGVRLLPYFDAYVVGSHPREKLFPGRAAERALAGGQAGNYPVLLVDGIAAGVWQSRRSGRNLSVTVEPFDRLTAAQRSELDEQVDRMGEFLKSKTQLTIGRVTAGPHA